MNDINQPMQLPPAVNNPARLGNDPAERIPITGVVSAMEAILRQPRRVMFQLREPGAGKVIGAMIVIAAVCSLIYGIILGSFSGGAQWWGAPVKACVGLLLSAVICLPSLYIFASLGGSQARLTEIVGLVAGLLALLAVLLIGFAPVAWLFSQSTESVVWMGALHLVFCLVATMFGVRFLKSGFFHSEATSNAAFNTWAIIFLLVLLQMSTALRPLLGTAPTFLPQEKKFFLSHWIDSMKPDR
jgi:hypothetical protein